MTIVVFVKGNSASFIKETERAKNHHACCWKIRQKAEGNRFLVVYIICKELFPRAESMMLLFREEKSKEFYKASTHHVWRENFIHGGKCGVDTGSLTISLPLSCEICQISLIHLSLKHIDWQCAKFNFIDVFHFLQLYIKFWLLTETEKCHELKKNYWCFLRVTSC